MRQMQPHTATIRVSVEAARAFRAASGPERRFAEKMLETLFARTRPVGLAEFHQLAKDANEEAVARGLTEQTLREILEDE